jgi:hypothetical protein
MHVKSSYRREIGDRSWLAFSYGRGRAILISTLTNTHAVRRFYCLPGPELDLSMITSFGLDSAGLRSPLCLDLIDWP